MSGCRGILGVSARVKSVWYRLIQELHEAAEAEWSKGQEEGLAVVLRRLKEKLDRGFASELRISELAENPVSPLYIYEEPSLPDTGAVPRNTWIGSAMSMRFADSCTRVIPSRILRGFAVTRTFINSARHSKSVMACLRPNIGESRGLTHR